MPIFEYRCNRCDNEFEKLVFLSDSADIECPSCNSSSVEKKVSAASVMTGSPLGNLGGGCSPSPAKGFG